LILKAKSLDSESKVTCVEAAGVANDAGIADARHSSVSRHILALPIG
jgi:hypothetical protein